MPRPDGKQIQPWARPRFTNARFAEEERVCWELRLRNMSLRQIAAQTGLSKSTVELRLRHAYEAFREDTQAQAEQGIQLELERLDAAQSAVVLVLEANHLVVSDGRVVRLEDGGPPLTDHGPVLQAVREYVRISESRRKLMGWDAPTRVEHTGGDVDAAVATLVALMDEMPAARPPAAEQV